ncbi:phage tail protein [Pseudomonas frederiksbergensis]|uniref:Phage tail protein n=1 Tax=Pseudomonas frederiksbergensis TaxID=104087 RepID=A0A6L5BZ19_9PSED|nr:phage tail protein [Pseudomonas frederiksbergensis]KAF2393152.1 hypothetical protein FX983_01113 [Pseudomonas frederiksbergensis]
MIKLKLPFWLEGLELTKLVATAQLWWGQAAEWLRWPYLQFDADTCHLSILELWAWQRDVTRFNGEPESLFRLRVKHAFINSVDAGSIAGLKRILVRLGVGYIEVSERMPGRDWDIVLLTLSDSQLSENPDLLRVLIRQYGRTCRRYDFVTITPVQLHVALAEFNDDQQTLVASL